MAGAAVADKKGANADKGPTIYTNSRLYVGDAEVLADLAAKRKMTVADLYRELFADKAKKLLIEATQKQLDKLKGE